MLSNSVGSPLLLFALSIAAGHITLLDRSKQDGPPAASTLYTATAETPSARFNAMVSSFLGDRGDPFQTYVDLNALYPTLSAVDRRQAAQVMSQIDTVMGRYDAADARFREAFPNAGAGVACPQSGFAPASPTAPVGSVDRSADILMLNESHSFIETRAIAFGFLKSLKTQGYTGLALEALASTPGYDASRPGIPADTDIERRGYPLDQSSAGLYLREPVYSQIIREAHRLGLKLIAYEAGTTVTREQREQSQAERIRDYLRVNQRAKVAVLAGYSHIWKTDGWLADVLQKNYGIKVVSIDLVAALGGCLPVQGKSDIGFKPVVFMSRERRPWSVRPDRVDVTVVAPLTTARSGSRASWLSLGGRRLPKDLPSSICHNEYPCLVEARYSDEARLAVPADRLVMMNSHDPSILYLDPGHYRLTIRNMSSEVTRKLVVSGVS